MPTNFRFPVFAYVLSLIFAAVCYAGPTNDNPNAPLQVRADSVSAALWRQAEPLYTSALKEVEEHKENHAANRYDKANKRDIERIARTSLKLVQLQRIADRLTLLAEPAGIDLTLRQQVLNERLNGVIQPYRKAEGIGTLTPLIAKTMDAISARQQRSVPRITTLIEQGKLELAEKELDEIFDDLHPQAIFADRRARELSLSPFLPLLNTLTPKMKEFRAAQTAELLATARANAMPNYEVIQNLVTASVASAKENGTAEWARQTLDGPALIDAWGEGWQKTQMKMLACYAIDRLRNIPVAATPPSELDQLSVAHQKFEQTMLTAMVELVQADAAQATPEETPDLYARYLQAIARMAARSADERIEQSLTAALSQLAQRAPAFAQDIAAYDQATRETLRWRRRMASAYARRHERDAVAVSDLMIKASGQGALKNRPMNAKPDVSELNAAGPLLVLDMAEVAVGQRAYARDFSPEDAGLAESRWEMYYYARIPATPIPAAEIAALQKDLLVTESSPPLTLAAAMAIESAQAGYLVSAGGEVSGVELESLLVHFVRNSSTAHLPVGILPDLSKAEMDDTCWQVDVKPSWLQHEYLFFTVP